MRRITSSSTVLTRRNIRFARQHYPDLSREVLARLRNLSTQLPLLLESGELLLLDSSWYVTHSGLLKIAALKRCAGITTMVPIIQGLYRLRGCQPGQCSVQDSRLRDARCRNARSESCTAKGLRNRDMFLRRTWTAKQRHFSEAPQGISNHRAGLFAATPLHTYFLLRAECGCGQAVCRGILWHPRGARGNS